MILMHIFGLHSDILHLPFTIMVGDAIWAATSSLHTGNTGLLLASQSEPIDMT